MTVINCSSDHKFCSQTVEDGFYTTSISLACQIAGISLLIFTSLSGNALLCYAVYKTSSKMSASAVFILNLAVTDILVGSLVLPFWILSTASLSWPLPNAVCEFTAFLTVTLMQCSIFSLSGIAVDRYFCISHPLRYPIEATKTRVSFVVIGIWAFCICIASFPIYGWGDYRFQPQTVPICNPEYISQVSFTIFLILFGMAMPFGLMLFSYIRIIQIARNHIQKIDSLQTTLEKPQTYPRQFPSANGESSSMNGSRHARLPHNRPTLSSKFSKNVKAVKKVLIAVGVFFLCWGPYVILNFWSVNNEHVPVPYIADLLTTFLAFANSSVNPVIFIILNKDLRNVIQKLGQRVFNCTAGATNVTDLSDLVTYVAEKSDHRVRTFPFRNKDPLVIRVNDLEVDRNNTQNNSDFIHDVSSADELEGGFGRGKDSGLRYGSSGEERTLPGSVSATKEYVTFT